jgi:hypothetical protein
MVKKGEVCSYVRAYSNRREKNALLTSLSRCYYTRRTNLGRKRNGNRERERAS